MMRRAVIALLLTTPLTACGLRPRVARPEHIHTQGALTPTSFPLEAWRLPYIAVENAYSENTAHLVGMLGTCYGR